MELWVNYSVNCFLLRIFPRFSKINKTILLLCQIPNILSSPNCPTYGVLLLCILWNEMIFKKVVSTTSSLFSLTFILKMTHDSELTCLMVSYCFIA